MIDYAFVREVVMAQAGIVLDLGKEYLIDARLSTLARSEGLTSGEDVIARVRSCCAVQAAHPPGEACWRRKTAEAFTTNETSFYRDLEPFEFLRTDIVPALLERRKCARELRFWYAAASTGQEPYSTVMTLHEHFPQLATWQVDHYGTDLSAAALAKARAGRYSQFEVNRGLPVRMLLKYFVQHGTEWHLRDELRKSVRFDQLNLHGAWPVQRPFDVVFLRNVMIYFDVPAKKRLLGRVFEMLRLDGYLFLGAAETTLNLDPRFERVPSGRAGCYRIARSPA